MKWKIELNGSGRGLEELSESFDEDPRTFEENGKYYLWSSKFEQLSKAGDVRDEGKTIIKMIRCLGEIDSLSVSNLEYSCLVEIQKDGSERRKRLASVTAKDADRAEVRLSVGDELLPSKAEQTYEYTQLALEDDTVQELIELRDRGKHWVNLYRIYEHIESNIESDIAIQDWLSGPEETRFTCTANDPEAIGHEARHAGDSSNASVEQMSHDQMSHEEAKALINDLIDDWLRHRMEVYESSKKES